MTAVHAKGLPGWIDLAADDVQKAKEFYSNLFGWEITDSPDTGSMPYALISNNGKSIGGMMGKMNPGQPTAWQTYLETDNIDQTIADINANGGQTYMPATDMPNGKFTFASGKADEPFGVFQSTNSFEAFGSENGDLVWFELQAMKNFSDVIDFYEKVFGTSYDKTNDTDQMRYFTFDNSKEEPVGGVFDATKEAQNFYNGFSQWVPNFAVDDVEVYANKVQDLGGKVERKDIGTPFGDFAAVRDPQGALFTIMKLN